MTLRIGDRTINELDEYKWMDIKTKRFIMSSIGTRESEIELAYQNSLNENKEFDYSKFEDYCQNRVINEGNKLKDRLYNDDSIFIVYIFI